MLRTIVVVGGGFSGTVITANLLRNPPGGPTRLVLVERRPEIGRGVAYAARGSSYMLNVPAGRMSATSAEPRQFLEFAQRRIPQVDAEQFLPRQLYGEYLQELLLAAELQAPRHIRLECIQGEVTEIVRLDRAKPLQVRLGDGRILVADDVVLACGNPPPADLKVTAAVADHPRYVRDACSLRGASPYTGTTVLIGTGLTMADIVLAADDRSRTVFHAISRHGLVPPVQTAFRTDAFKGDGNALLLSTASSLRSLVRAARILAREAEQSGGDWREAVTYVRNLASQLWQRLPERDRRRFLRHVRAYWDVHRHRLPPQTVHRITELKRLGRLHIHAGHLAQLKPAHSRIHLGWRPRGSDQLKELTADWVINCTGPDYDLGRSNDPLFQSLLRSGLAVPDACGLGLRTGSNGAVIDADGWPGTHLFYVGPMLRADHWEATAAAELRTHAERLAGHLVTERV